MWITIIWTLSELRNAIVLKDERMDEKENSMWFSLGHGLE